MASPTDPTSSLLSTVTALRHSHQPRDALILLQSIIDISDTPPSPHLLHIGVKVCNEAYSAAIQSRPFPLLKLAKQWLARWPTTTDVASQAKHSKWTVVTLVNLAGEFTLRRKFHKALAALMEALETAKKTEGRGKAEVLIAIAEFYGEVRSFGEMDRYARQALSVLQSALKSGGIRGKDKITKITRLYIRAFELIGKAEECLGNRNISRKAYKKGLDISKKHIKGGKEEGARRGRSSGLGSLRATVLSSVQSAISHSITTSPRRSVVPRPPATPKDRYYSEEKLTTLHRKLNEGNVIPFLSTDQYFSTTITKQMNLEQDVSHLRPLSAYPLPSNGVRSAQERDEEDRRKVSELRFRRKPARPHSGEIRGRDHVLMEIRKLEETVLRNRSNYSSPRKRKARKEENRPVEIKYPPQRKVPPRPLFQVHPE